jgi:hypothetical protein
MNNLQVRYNEWRQENQDVFELIEKTALSMCGRGRRFSIDGVVHHVRFNEFFTGYRDDPYRINNNHVAYIARELLAEYPGMRSYITTRQVAT